MKVKKEQDLSRDASPISELVQALILEILEESPGLVSDLDAAFDLSYKVHGAAFIRGSRGGIRRNEIANHKHYQAVAGDMLRRMGEWKLARQRGDLWEITDLGRERLTELREGINVNNRKSRHRSR